MQTIDIDHEVGFTNVFVEARGSISDSQVLFLHLLMSNHFIEVIVGRGLNGLTIKIEGVDVCEFIVVMQVMLEIETHWCLGLEFNLLYYMTNAISSIHLYEW